MTKPPFLVEPYCDDLGHQKVVHDYAPQSGLRAIVVVGNTACGPAIGGVRLAADVSLEEVFRLARAMTLKNAVAGLPQGMTGGAVPPLPEDPAHAAGGR
jgi:glutamate dehydrogenase (NAD(P)+)/glutamate dehydrogenase (NADP+)